MFPGDCQEQIGENKWQVKRKKIQLHFGTWHASQKPSAKRYYSFTDISPTMGSWSWWWVYIRWDLEESESRQGGREGEEFTNAAAAADHLSVNTSTCHPVTPTDNIVHSILRIQLTASSTTPGCWITVTTHRGLLDEECIFPIMDEHTCEYSYK